MPTYIYSVAFKSTVFYESEVTEVQQDLLKLEQLYHFGVTPCKPLLPGNGNKEIPGHEFG